MDDTQAIWEVKQRVKTLLDDRGINYNIAKQLGKNTTYLQKFLKEKSPKRLDEDFRRQLAEYLQIDEQELTDLPISRQVFAPDIIKVDMLDVVACCGNGIETYTENVVGQWSMPIADFKQITSTTPDNIKLIAVKGDSMQPTIKEGDFCFVDISKRQPDSDGMFLLRIATGLAVKRIQGGLTNNLIIKSDNPKYDNLTAAVGEVSVLGKVIYILKAEKVG